MFRRFDVLLMDFYGTVTDGDRDAVESVCRKIVETCELPITPAQLVVTWGERFFHTIDESNRANFRTLYECEVESLRRTLARFGDFPDPAPFVTELEDYWRNPPVHEDALEFLRENRVPICCVSNADTYAIKAAMNLRRLRFDSVITSESARSYKPDGDIFRQALAAMNMTPDRAIHVGDSLHSDIKGASAVGIATAWIHRENRIHDIGAHPPDFRIRRLTELHAILSS